MKNVVIEIFEDLVDLHIGVEIIATLLIALSLGGAFYFMSGKLLNVEDKEPVAVVSISKPADSLETKKRYFKNEILTISEDLSFYGSKSAVR